MHRDDHRLDLAEEPSEYEAPAACDIGPAEQHTRGPNSHDLDNVADPDKGMLRGLG